MKITQKEINQACFHVGQLEALILMHKFHSVEAQDVFYQASSSLIEFLHKVSEEIYNEGA